MPSKKSRKPRRSSGRSGQRDATMSVRGRRAPDFLSGWPDRMRCTLAYQSNARVNPGVLTGSGLVFSMNSVFDPDVTGAGHQPREFDTAATLYNKYRVMSADYKVEVRQRAAHGIAAWLVPTNEVGPFAVADSVGEMLRAIHLGTTGANQPVLTHRQRFDNAAILGQTRTQYMSNEDTSSLVTTNPAERTYVHLFAQQLDNATACDYEVVVHIYYDVEFFDKKVLAPSALSAALAALRVDDLPEAGDDQPVVVSRGALPQQSNPSRMGAPRLLTRQ